MPLRKTALCGQPGAIKMLSQAFNAWAMRLLEIVGDLEGTGEYGEDCAAI
jgi:hypothetical protein